MSRCSNCFSEIGNQSICPKCGYKKGDAPKELYHLFPSTVLKDRYIIGEVLGFGGFGITYKAWDKKLDTIVAIKEYYPSGIVNRVPGEKEVIIYAQKRRKEFDYGRDRFLDEARNMAKFKSETNIVNVFEFFEENNTAYIVMEYLDGITLNKYLSDNEGIIDIDTGVQIAEAICNALQKIHSFGIVHRDVSPDNIFLCINGAIKLIDFGAARFSQDENQLMTIILKPGFAPPEQYDKINKQGPWTDIYALGATLYYIITGEKPEESTNRKIKDELPSPKDINSDIPEYLSNTIMKAMAIDLHLRFQSIDEFLAALHQNKKVLPIAVEKKRKKRRRSLGISIVALAIVVGIIISVFSWNKEKEEETLPDCEITIWIEASGNEIVDSAKEEAYKTVITDFNSSFANVKIHLETISSSDYSKSLKNNGSLPNIYEYNGTLANAKVLDLDNVYHSSEASSCSMLQKAKDFFGNYNYLPTGFNIPVVYMNRYATEYSNDKISDINELITYYDTSGQYGTFIFDDNNIRKTFELDNDYYDENAIDEFVDDNYIFYGSDTTKYFYVRENFPAQYKILACDKENVFCSYDNILCAVDTNKNENKATERFLQFLLNNNAQDVFYVRNQNSSLPINDNVLDVLVSVYDDYEHVFDNKNNYRFEK